MDTIDSGQNTSTRAIKFLTDHATRQRLIDLGWSFAQIESVSFRHRSIGCPFSQWSLHVARPGIPTSEEWRLARGFAALKWLVLEDPPAGRHLDEAWDCARDAMDVPADEITERLRLAQSERARKPRGKLGEGDRTLNQIIQTIATSPDNRDLPPSKLIETFIGELTALGLEPLRIGASKEGLPKTIEYKRYGADEAVRRTISYRRFCTVVADARRARRAHSRPRLLDPSVNLPG